MIDETFNSVRLTHDYLQRLVAGLPQAELVRQPPGVPNHPLWVLGHLVVSCQAIGGELGLAPWLPPAYGPLYGTGSTPVPDATAYLDAETLLDQLADGLLRLENKMRDLGPAGLAAPLPDERFRTLLPTVGHAALHILTAHFAVHVGQVSVWRRAAGHAPPAEPFI